MPKCQKTDETDDTDTDDTDTDDSGTDDTDNQTVEDIFIETESGDLTDTDWKIKTDIEGFSGDGYIIWEGADQFWKDASKIGQIGRLEYKIKIETPGKYLFV